MSKALKGYSDISEETRQRVLRTAEDLDYRFQREDSVQGSVHISGAVGLIAPALAQMLESGYYRRMLLGMAEEAAREKRWAELDRRDSLKAAEKVQKALEKERARKLKLLLAQRKQEVKDSIKLEKYIAKYRKQYEREQKRKASRQRTPAIEEGRDVPTPVEPQVQPGGSDAVLRDDGPADDGAVLGGGSVPGA